MTVLATVLIAYSVMAAANPMQSTVHGDGWYTYLWARSAVFDGDFDFHNDYTFCGDPWGLLHSPVGDDMNYWNLGPALLWAPILAADRMRGIDYQSALKNQACRGPLTEHAVYGSMIGAWLTVVIGFWIARQRFGEGPALFGAVLIGLTTSLAYYGTTMLSYGHGASSFGGAVFVLAWDRLHARPDLKRWLLLGAAMGLALLMRSQNVVLAVLPAVTFVRQLSVERSVRPLLHGCAAVVVSAVVFSPQIGFWYWMTGSFFTVSQGEHYMRWLFPQMPQALFSMGNGLFPWQPSVYFSTIGLFAMAGFRSSRLFGFALLALFVADTYVVASVYDWWGSVGFPARRFDLLAAPFMIGAAAFAAAVQRGSRGQPGFVGWVAAVPLILVLWLCNVALSQAIARGMRSDVQHTSLEHAHAWLDMGWKPVWKAIGNPLTWPASIPFALIEGQHVRDWDVVGSQELFYHDHQTLSYREFESTLFIVDERGESYLSGTFDEVESMHGQSARQALPGDARILLPLHWPDAGAVELTWAAQERAATVALVLNGVALGTFDVEERFQTTTIRFPPHVTRHGLNYLQLHIAGGAIGITRVVVRDGEPPPRIEQMRRNEELRERVRANRPRRSWETPEVAE